MAIPVDAQPPRSHAAATVTQVLQSARACGLDRLDAQLLLSHAMGRSRPWLLSHGEAIVPQEAQVQVAGWIQQRADGMPIAYLLGTREFHGVTLRITPAVLDPRPDTETLVDWALDTIQAQASRSWAVVDLGTGSGAIALALAQATIRRTPAVQITATDRSPEALDVARHNAQRLGHAIALVESSWWGALQGRRFDLVVSNPPYIPEGDPHLPALKHEPLSALVSGRDGLDDLRTIIEGAPNHLRPGGALLLEHGWDQGAAVAALLHASGFQDIAHRYDLGGHIRCTGGTLLR